MDNTLFRIDSVLKSANAPNSVVIVGNGTVAPLATDVIARADLVIRFNECRSFEDSRGRTDIVAVCNTGRPAKAMLASENWPSHVAVSSAQEIWCVRDPRKMFSLRRVLAATHPELGDFCDDGTVAFQQFCQQRGKHCHVIDESVHDLVDDALFAFGTEPYVVPSSGMIVIAWAMQAFAGSEISITGFSHEGWELHPFAAERQLINEYVSSGRIGRL